MSVSLATPMTTPLPLGVFRALASFGVLGLALALGSSEPALWMTGPAWAIGVFAIPPLITGPAMLVAHEFLGIQRDPRSMLTAISNGLEQTGRLALGLSPIALFFSATSDLGVALACFAFPILGLLTVFAVAAEIWKSASGTHRPSDLVLILGWLTLGSACGARMLFLALNQLTSNPF